MQGKGSVMEWRLTYTQHTPVDYLYRPPMTVIGYDLIMLYRTGLNVDRRVALHAA